VTAVKADAEGALAASVRIVVVDDHTLFRRGLTALLAREPGFSIVGEAADGFEGIKTVGTQQPDVVLLDLHMPGISGLEAIDAIRKEAPGAQVVMLTVSEDEDDLLAALRGGASGYLLKNIDSDFLVDAIRRARVRTRGEPAPDATLSPREREILTHVARGASNKEIARSLAVAESTVKIHVQHILRKLGLSSRVQAAIWAVENGVTARD
jgi:two-component system nitrate/nitrite response regulator NarL